MVCAGIFIKIEIKWKFSLKYVNVNVPEVAQMRFLLGTFFYGMQSMRILGDGCGILQCIYDFLSYIQTVV